MKDSVELYLIPGILFLAAGLALMGYGLIILVESDSLGGLGGLGSFMASLFMIPIGLVVSIAGLLFLRGYLRKKRKESSDSEK